LTDVGPRGSTCNEQTKRVCTPAARKSAQKSCAPTSLDPSADRASAMKSAFSRGGS
jgi:hypothetical protein